MTQSVPGIHLRAALLAGLAALAGASAATAATAPAASPAELLAYRAPYTPTRDDELLQQVPAATNPAIRKIRALRSGLDRNPSDFATADELAKAYIDFGRELGDAHYAGYAEAVLTPWLRQPSPPVAALVAQATILQYRHEFGAARESLRRALAKDRNSAQAWLTLATLDMAQGDYAAAAKDCVQVAAHGGYDLGIACTGTLKSYTGQAQQGLVMLKLLEGEGKSIPPGFSAWIQGLLAETCERLGNWVQAEAHYRKALRFTPNDNFLQVAYADFLLDRGRPAEVLTLLANSSQSDTAYLRIALAKTALRHADAQTYTWIMAARFEALRQRGSDYFGREQVRFALWLQHDSREALQLAQSNWQVQRAPWDARVLLEAAQAARQPQAAAEVLEFVKKTKLQDPVIEALAAALRAGSTSRGTSP